MDKEKIKKEKIKKEKKIKLNLKVIIIAIFLMTIIVMTIVLMYHKNNSQDNLKNEMNQDYTLTQSQNLENVKIEDGIKENISKELATEKTFEGMKVKNIRLVRENGLTHFTAIVENNSKKDFISKKIVIIFTDKEGKDISKLNGYLPNIKAGASSAIDASSTSDLSNAYDFRIEVKV